MHVILVRPPVDVLHKFSKPVESLALGYLAAAVREAGASAAMLDGMLHDWPITETVDRILAERSDLIGFTTVLNHFPPELRLIVKELRRRAYAGAILVGGHAMSFVPDRILAEVSEIDAVICGEGEYPIAEIARRLVAGSDWRDVPGVASRGDDGAIRLTPPLRADDLDRLPLSARDLVEPVIDRDGLVAMSTSRGCYARCTFCSIPRFYGLQKGRPLSNGGWLARSVDAVVAEMVTLVERYGVRELLIVDDEFFGGCEAGIVRARDFARTLAAQRLPLEFVISCRAENIEPDVFEDLRAAGLVHVFIGIEAGDAGDLHFFAKGHSVKQNRRAVETVKGQGLSFQPGFMMFHYGSTLASLRNNVAFLREIGEFKPTTINSEVDPHFGTPMLAAMRHANVLVDEGLTLHASFRNERVACARRVAAMCGERFVPFMDFLAGTFSAVTYEWRRPVPGRTAETAALLAGFERMANERIASTFSWALDVLEEGAPPERVLNEADSRLERSVMHVSVAQALVAEVVRQREGRLKYWTQRERIGSYRDGNETSRSVEYREL